MCLTEGIPETVYERSTTRSCRTWRLTYSMPSRAGFSLARTGFDPDAGNRKHLMKWDGSSVPGLTGWILEIDVRSYFDSIVRSALVGICR